jgi:WD40 repeat protein
MKWVSISIAILLGTTNVFSGPVEPPVINLDALVADLASENFRARQKATASLAALGFEALPELEKLAAKHEDAGIRGELAKAVKLIVKKSITEVRVVGRQDGGHHLGWLARSIFTPDGSHLITGGINDIGVWDIETGKRLRTFNKGAPTWAFDFSPDGKHLAVAGAPTVRIYDWRSGELVTEIPAHAGEGWGVAYSPDGKQITSCAFDATVRISDIATRKVLKTIPVRHPLVRPLMLVPDGILVGYMADHEAPSSLVILDEDTGEPVREFKGNDRAIADFELSADGTQLLTGGFDSTARIWDYATGKEVQRFVGHPTSVEAVAFAPDGRHIVTAGADDNAGSVRLWNRRSGEVVWRTPPTHGVVLSITFTPDGRHFVTTGKDSTIRLWRYGLMP